MSLQRVLTQLYKTETHKICKAPPTTQNIRSLYLINNVPAPCVNTLRQSNRAPTKYVKPFFKNTYEINNI